jgi:hypothetical protein
MLYSGALIICIGNSFVPVILYVVRDFTVFKRAGLHLETGIESELAPPLPLPCQLAEP